MNSEKFRGVLTKDINNADIILTGYPLDKNASIGKGASLAPDHIRELSVMVPALSKDGYLIDKVKLYDNLNIDISDFELMQKETLNLYKTNKFNIFLGGDHSISIATERAFIDYAKSIKKTPVVIHIDAHPDICDVYHDSKYSHACPNFRAIEYGYEDKNVTMIGIRGFEAQEIETFKKHPSIDVFKAIDVKKMGVEALLTLIVSKYKDPKYEVYLSYDIDANDPAFAPGTGTPEAFGLSNFETMAIVTGLISNLNITCMDLVEIAPPLDVNNITSWLGLKTIYEIFNALIKTNKLSK